MISKLVRNQGCIKETQCAEPFYAEATFIQSTQMQRLFKKHLNPVMLVLIE